jgi:hypothetical protein
MASSVWELTELKRIRKVSAGVEVHPADIDVAAFRAE